jgi:hypothetical protein
VLAEGPGREQKKRWANAFATALTQIFGNFRNGLYRGDGVLTKLALNGAQVIMQKIEDLFGRGNGCRAHSLSV